MTAGAVRWSFWKTFGLVFGSVFSALFGFTQPSWLMDLMYVWEPLGEAWHRAWNAQVGWFSTHVLGFSHPVRWLPSEGVDTEFHWTMTLVILVESLVAAGVWAGIRVTLQRGEPHYDRAWSRLSLWLSVVLASELIPAGILKLFLLHGHPVEGVDLLRPIGAFPRPEFPWMDMGISPGYQIFAGSMEICAGVLVLFARTRLVGLLFALSSVGFLVVLNLGFDVFAKRQALILFIITLVLLAPHCKGFTNLVLLRRPAEPVHTAPLFRHAWLSRVVTGAVAAMILAFVSSDIQKMRELRAEQTSAAALPQHPLHGLWRVKSFVELDGSTVENVPDSQQWTALWVETTQRGTWFKVEPCEGEPQWYAASFVDGQLKLGEDVDAPALFTFEYAQPAPAQLMLTSTANSPSTHILLVRVDETKLPLKDHPGVNWVREAPWDHSSY